MATNEEKISAGVEYLLTAERWEDGFCRIGWRLDGKPIEDPVRLAYMMRGYRPEPRQDHSEHGALSHPIGATIEDVADWFAAHGVPETATIEDLYGGGAPAGVFTLTPDQQLAFKLRWL